MIPQRINVILYIIFTFLFFSSCQKKECNSPKVINTKAEVKNLISIGNRFYDAKEFDSAFYYYNKVKFICNPVTDSENYVSTLNDMAEIQTNHGDYIGSESTLTEVVPYLKYVKDQKYIWNTYIEFGNNYLFTNDLSNALLYYNMALKLKTKEWRKLIAKNNIAVVLMEQQKYDEALEIFFSLIIKSEIVQVTENYQKILDNIGFCHYKIGDPRALSYLQNALKLALETNDAQQQGKTYMHLSQFYENSDPGLSKKYALLSYEKFGATDNVDNRMSALKLLINNSKDAELKKYSLLYIKLNDSITEFRQKAKNQFAKVKYDSKKEKDENLRLKTHKAENELQLEKQKNRNIVSYIIIVLSLSLILVLYFYLTSRGNREKIEATYKSETRIAKKLHDELANDIYHTMAFAENRNLSLIENKEQLLNNLDAIYSRTRDISKENCVILTNENYVFSLREMISEFNTLNINLILNGLDTISWNVINKNKKITLYRVLQELLVNMRKHSQATLVGITFKIIDKNIVVTYTDNGKGIDKNKMAIKNGLYNIQNRILNIKGEIDIDSAPDKGFKVFFKFPI